MPGSFAAVAGNFCLCPVCDPKPHVGGPAVPAGKRTVLIGGMPAVVVGDTAVCAGPPPNKTQSGSTTVLINGMAACRLGDPTSHGGMIVTGAVTVLMG
jgi:uncharacterized Zn-binding protein involved in type VI secretion